MRVQKIFQRSLIITFMVLYGISGMAYNNPLFPTQEWNDHLMKEGSSIINNALARQGSCNNNTASSSIAIVTFSTPERKEFTDITLGTLKKYCAKWGYSYHGFDKVFDTSRKPQWNKIKALAKVMDENPAYSWVVWIDDDILITNPFIKIEDFIKSFGNGNDFIFSQDILAERPEVMSYGWKINSGIFFLRNNANARNFLDDVWEYGLRPNDTQFNDQFAIINCVDENSKYRNVAEALPLGVLQVYLAQEIQQLSDPKCAAGAKWTPYVFSAHACGMKHADRVKTLKKMIAQGDLPIYI